MIPCSDMAGEVIAVGEDVKNWKKGDRVCSNFCTDHIFGDTNAEIIQTSLGGQSNGVLTQYRNFPAHVNGIGSFFVFKHLTIFQSLVAIPQHLSYNEASTLP